MITAAKVRNLFIYDPETGEFRWRQSRGPRVEGEIAGGKNQKNDYWMLGIDYKKHLAHRIAWLYHYGEWPKGQIDHINGNPRDNRIGNLRVVDIYAQNQNRKIPKQNKSGVMGVCWDKVAGKWRATVGTGGKNKYLGLFADLEEAEKAVKAERKRLGYHPNHGQR